MKHIKLQMIREDLEGIPGYGLPDGYSFKMFERGDEGLWANIETRVDEFDSEAAALKRFGREFGEHIDEMGHRCLFLMDPGGEAVGTATAWYGDLHGDGNIRGRIHWVGIMPEYQGRGLSKPLLSRAMEILAEFHDSAYLTSQTTSWQAVNMYLDFGFRPVRLDDGYEEAWSLLEEKLGRAIGY